MIANFFSKTRPINTLAIVTLLFFIYILSTIINFDGVISASFFVKRVTYFILLLIILFSVNFIVRKNNLVKDNSYTLFLYVVLLGLFPFTVLDFKLAIINFILLLSYRRIYSLRTQKDVKEKLFDSAFWIGIATLIYSWSILILFLVFLAAYVFDKWTWRNALIPIVGFFTPIIIYMAYLTAMNESMIIATIFDFNLFFEFENYNSLKLLIP
ncbi:MAG: hypothetical protein HKN90_00275, partial [Flavobacteriaceae bacterium]|nr:hypothetical protein [Flavobacteriaceae bacterium]